ncbi:hypothetical protein ACFPK9_01245 [Rubritalea spongiae]|uniref:Uncharacterized protein n=1 Tax=Rubritalea spongiae TaxID=430797 RepID=A0ABW5DZG1_9BACT
MSRAGDLRDALKASIVAANIGLTADDIIIARQGDIFREIEDTVSRSENGICLHILSPKKRNLAPMAERPRWETELVLRLWVQPLYHEGQKPEEEIMEDLENHLSQLVLNTAEPRALQAAAAIEVQSSYDVADADYNVHEVQVKTIIQN